MNHPPLRFGIFLAPFHPVREDPTACLDRDLELVKWLDSLRYDEAWIGEHHSAGYEIIASPEIFLAIASQHTKHIRLGTGVISVPYHHPFMIAERIVQLDHMTRGRIMFGSGPGALQSDARMLGIEASTQRERLDEGLGVILRLLRGETVTHEGSWFTLKEARLQLRPWSRNLEYAVASQISPAGARIAGKHGAGLLSLGATSFEGFNMLGMNWQVYTDTSQANGHPVDRSRWRLVGPMHIAETREQAKANVRFGLGDWLFYFREVAALPLGMEGSVDEVIENMIAQKFAVIGTPDDAIEQLENLQQQSGGFGAFLQLAHNWASWDDTKKSYELFSRYVMPRFQDRNAGRVATIEAVQKAHGDLLAEYGGAIAKEFEKQGIKLPGQ
ncbi:MAG TPA: LLM class flavin-dependent oxidoreductase [Myxococcota bacterium]|nr:LLM class flavin-dependent oxidoreductase [Myxococcota bacterium]